MFKNKVFSTIEIYTQYYQNAFDIIKIEISGIEIYPIFLLDIRDEPIK